MQCVQMTADFYFTEQMGVCVFADYEENIYKMTVFNKLWLVVVVQFTFGVDSTVAVNLSWWC